MSRQIRCRGVLQIQRMWMLCWVWAVGNVTGILVGKVEISRVLFVEDVICGFSDGAFSGNNSSRRSQRFGGRGFLGGRGPIKMLPKNGEITRPIGFILNSNTCGGINAGIAIQGAAPLRNCKTYQCAPSVISWFINPINYSCKYQ